MSCLAVFDGGIFAEKDFSFANSLERLVHCVTPSLLDISMLPSEKLAKEANSFLSDRPVVLLV